MIEDKRRTLEVENLKRVSQNGYPVSCICDIVGNVYCLLHRTTLVCSRHCIRPTAHTGRCLSIEQAMKGNHMDLRACGYVNCKHSALNHVNETGSCQLKGCQCYQFENEYKEPTSASDNRCYCNGNITSDYFCAINQDGSITHHWRCKHYDVTQPPVTLRPGIDEQPGQVSFAKVANKQGGALGSSPLTDYCSCSEAFKTANCRVHGLVEAEPLPIEKAIAAVFAERPAPVEPIRFTQIQPTDTGLFAIDQHGQLWFRYKIAGGWTKAEMPTAK